MIVCSCLRVTDRTIDAAIASGATTVAEVTARCGAGGRCGGCRPVIEAMVVAHQAAVAIRGAEHAAA